MGSDSSKQTAENHRCPLVSVKFVLAPFRFFFDLYLCLFGVYYPLFYIAETRGPQPRMTGILKCPSRLYSIMVYAGVEGFKKQSVRKTPQPAARDGARSTAKPIQPR